ncbi:MAG: hypothetical protein IIC67_01610 [Thaumarchaeota archaeon]|nr:hypothetical protein [Nitrososphaerota archaeon]
MGFFVMYLPLGAFRIILTEIGDVSLISTTLQSSLISKSPFTSAPGSPE